MKQLADSMNYYGAGRIPFLFIISFEGDDGMVLPLDEVDRETMLYDINGVSNDAAGSVSFPDIIHFSRKPIDYAAYEQAFSAIQEQMYRGNTYLLNLTCKTAITTSLTLKEIFSHAQAKYRLWIDQSFVVFSPETFVQIDNNRISSFPMKGTIAADIPNAPEILLNDEKEKAEHVTIVDLIRNDVNRIASEVKVERFRYLDLIETNLGSIYQTSSHISGRLDHDYHKKIGTIITSMLPAGSITGAPKKKTVEIIKRVEANPRGFYTGVFGIFNGYTLDSGVMIRFIEKDNGALYYRSGGGITVYSDPLSEYQEMLDKIYVPFVF